MQGDRTRWLNYSPLRTAHTRWRDKGLDPDRALDAMLDPWLVADLTLPMLATRQGCLSSHLTGDSHGTLNSISFHSVCGFQSEVLKSVSRIARTNFGCSKTQLHDLPATACTSLGFMVLSYLWLSPEISPSSVLHSIFYGPFRLTWRCNTAWLAIPILLEEKSAFQNFGTSEVLNALKEPTLTFHLGPFCNNSWCHCWQPALDIHPEFSYY